jgi:putative phosphoesterase
MNPLSQQENGFLGSPEAVEKLIHADSAKLLVISDTHGHYNVLEAIVREFGPTCDALLFAGDGMWDIVQYIENAQEAEKLKDALPPVVVFVAGNGDGDQYRVSLPVVGDAPEPEDVPGFTINVPNRQIMRACGYSILLVHGHRHSVDVSLEVLVDSAHVMDCDIAIFGHTHIPFAESFSHILALNPGSPARPRGHSEPGFAVIELDSNSTEPKTSFYIVNAGLRGNFYFDETFR